MPKVVLLTFVMSAVILFIAAVDGKRTMSNNPTPREARILFNHKRGSREGNFGMFSRWNPEEPEEDHSAVGSYIDSLRRSGVLYHRQDREVLPLVRLKKSLRHRRDDKEDELLKILRL